MNLIATGRMSHRALLAMLLAGLALLQGCSDTIDARQTREIQGLIYKLNKDDPFSGTITNVGVQALGVIDIGICNMEVKKGMPHGDTICKTNEGKKVLELTYAEGKKHGKEERWDAATGSVLSRTHWDQGRRNGLEELFNPANNVRVRKLEWEKGIRHGREQAWDLAGKTLLTDLEWKAGFATGFKKEAEWEENLKDSQRHGTVKRFVIEYTDPTFDAANRVRNESERLRAGYFFPLLGNAQLRQHVEYVNGEVVRVVYDRAKEESDRQAALAPCIELWRAAHDKAGNTMVLGGDLIRWRESCQQGNSPVAPAETTQK